jgi:diaminopimelate epimerase
MDELKKFGEIEKKMSIKFAKLHGAGNDYIAIDGRGIDRDWAQLSLDMSRLAFGVGSDGIVLVQEPQEAAAAEGAQVRMRVYNPDGSEAEMSGNGIRLFSKFVIDRKIAIPGSDGLIVETGGGVRTVVPTMDNDGKMTAARVAMGIPEFEPAKIPVDVSVLDDPSRVHDFPLDVGGHTIKVTCLSVGNPHAVAFPDEPVDEFPLLEIGPLVESHPMFPNRINFEIVNVLSRSQIKARIFERGAGETLSSGTGSTASASAARAHGLVDDEVEVLVKGGMLKISWDETGEAFLEGPAVEVFEGVWPD